MTQDPFQTMRGSYGMAETTSVGTTEFLGTAYSGTDVRAFILPTFQPEDPAHPVFNVPPIVKDVTSNQYTSQDVQRALNRNYIPNLAGVSLSTHRDKQPLFNLGRMNPEAFVGSRRTTAGTMVFFLTDTSPITLLLSPESRMYLYHADELPPFDLYLTFMNEAGSWSSCVVQGITILDEGTVIEQSGSEGIVVTYSYMAMSSTPITPGYFSLLPNLTERTVAAGGTLIYQDNDVFTRVTSSDNTMTPDLNGNVPFDTLMTNYTNLGGGSSTADRLEMLQALKTLYYGRQ